MSQGGRISYSSVRRSLEGEDEIRLVSVGVDIGSSTSHLVSRRFLPPAWSGSEVDPCGRTLPSTRARVRSSLQQQWDILSWAIARSDIQAALAWRLEARPRVELG